MSLAWGHQSVEYLPQTRGKQLTFKCREFLKFSLKSKNTVFLKFDT